MKNLDAPILQSYIFFRNITKDERSLPPAAYHRHNAYEIFLFLGGSRKVCVEDGAYRCRPGDLYLIRPETFHAGLCEEACEYDRIIMNIKPEFISEICRKGAQVGGCFDMDGAGPVRWTHLDCRERDIVIELFERYREAQKNGGGTGTLLCDTYMLQFLIYVNGWFKREGSGAEDETDMPKLVRDVMEYIHVHLTEDITMESLSKRFYFDGRYISRLFGQHTGATIRTYIVGQRVALAKRLLREGCNVTEACSRAGFHDYANFLRSFKKVAGVSPGRFRRGSDGGVVRIESDSSN